MPQCSAWSQSHLPQSSCMVSALIASSCLNFLKNIVCIWWFAFNLFLFCRKKLQSRSTKVPSFYFDLTMIANYWGCDEGPRRLEINASLMKILLNISMVFCCSKQTYSWWKAFTANDKSYCIVWVVSRTFVSCWCCYQSFWTLQHCCFCNRYHHTGPINSIYALREALSLVVEEVCLLNCCFLDSRQRHFHPLFKCWNANILICF